MPLFKRRQAQADAAATIEARGEARLPTPDSHASTSSGGWALRPLPKV